VPSKRVEQLRSQGQRTRESLVSIAHEALSGSGDVSLNSIAKAAGVGIGTLYRHFPTRDALILEIYRHEVEQLVRAAPQLLATRPPLVALREWLDRLTQYAMTKAGLADALRAATSRQGESVETHGPVVGAIAQLLAANERAGTITAGMDPEDFLLTVGGLWLIDPADDWQVRAGRLMDFVVGGLRATTALRLSGTPDPAAAPLAPEHPAPDER
jgi:AcrR family transcriptional regulator